MYSMFQPIAHLADFDYTLPGSIKERELNFGNHVLLKEFYSTSLCFREDGKKVGLKKFARSWLETTQAGKTFTLAKTF